MRFGRSGPRRTAARTRARRPRGSCVSHSWHARSLPGGLTVSKRISRASTSVASSCRSIRMEIMAAARTGARDRERPPARRRPAPRARAAEREQRGGGGQHAGLPPSPSAGGQRHGRAEDRADRGRAGAVEERARRAVLAQPRRSARRQGDRQERRREGDRGGEQRTAQAGRGPADERDGVDDRPGRQLAEGDGVEELRLGHPAVALDRVPLHQRDDHEAAAVGERADLQRGPGQRRAALAGRGEHDRPRVQRGVRAAAPGELQQPGGEQHDHDVGAGEHRGSGARGDVGRRARRRAAR